METTARSDLRIIGVQFRACNGNLDSIAVVCEMNSFDLLRDDQRRYVVKLAERECEVRPQSSDAGVACPRAAAHPRARLVVVAVLCAGRNGPCGSKL